MSLKARFLRPLALLALVAGVGACHDGGHGPLAPEAPSASLLGDTLQLVESTLVPTVTGTEAVIGLAGGVLHIPGGHSLSFPVGAVLLPTTIRASVDGGTVKVEFGPHGLLFPVLARPTLTLSYANAAGVTDADVEELVVVYLGEDGEPLEVLQTWADTDADVVKTRISHFSTYVLATD